LLNVACLARNRSGKATSKCGSARMIWVGVGRTGAEQGEPLSGYAHSDEDALSLWTASEVSPYKPKEKGANGGINPLYTGDAPIHTRHKGVEDVAIRAACYRERIFM